VQDTWTPSQPGEDEGMLFNTAAARVRTFHHSRVEGASFLWRLGLRPVSFYEGVRRASPGSSSPGARPGGRRKWSCWTSIILILWDFIQCKVKEERKAWALIAQGYEADFNGEAYSSIFFQNSNNSVRVTDASCRRWWRTKPGRPLPDRQAACRTHQARDLMKMMAEAAHACGDPGLQFDSIINTFNPCKPQGGSCQTPVSEYMFLDDTACNLASLNCSNSAMTRDFDITSYRSAVRTVFTAMDIMWTTPAIRHRKSRKTAMIPA